MRPHESDDAFAVRFEIPALEFTTVLGFAGGVSYELAVRHLFSRVSGARLPQHHITRLPEALEPAVWVDIDPLPDGCATVGFRGAVNSPRYEVELEGFHWDFSKVINSLVMDGAASSALLPVHSACLASAHGVVLLPGASGAGKSSISYAALVGSHQVLASELVFVREGEFLCGNTALTIDAAAIKIFGLPKLGSPDGTDKSRLVFNLDQQQPSMPISRVVFPQVHPGEVHVRAITSRRARMLLFENVITQLPLAQLLCQERWPIWRPPHRDVIVALMDEVSRLSELEPVIISGHPAGIVSAIVEDRI